MAETGPSTNTSNQAAINTKDGNAIQVLYRSEPSSKWYCWLHILHCPYSFCYMDHVKNRTYFQVHENRIEYNFPGACSFWSCLDRLCCRCRPNDDVTVMYFDHKLLQNAGKAGVCTPAFTHCHPFPTCCDLCGECLVLYSYVFRRFQFQEPTTQVSNSDGCCGGCCCRQWTMIPNFFDAAGAAAAIGNCVSASIV